MTAPRFSDPTLEGIADEFIEVLRVKHDAEAKLVELFDKFAEESLGCEQRFSDQEIRAITEEIEAMRAVIATWAEPAQPLSGARKSPLEPGAYRRTGPPTELRLRPACARKSTAGGRLDRLRQALLAGRHIRRPLGVRPATRRSGPPDLQASVRRRASRCLRLDDPRRPDGQSRAARVVFVRAPHPARATRR